MKTLLVALVLIALAFPATAQRMKSVDGVRVPLTAAEELQRDAEEAAWVDYVANKDTIKAERVREAVRSRMQNDPLINVLIRRMAAKEGKTVKQISDELEAMLP
ncbi:hypothetical protein LCGC14_0899410 [marine sediment metagenome]|uniref:Uncharacterized protein n=1 Tax=marine sediment metagenome TaxID=412755 RepID=A0A0F9P1P0_9ZZZZ